MTLDIAVVLPDGREITAGTIDEVGTASRTVLEFRYTPDYLRDAAAYALSPELPLDSGRFIPRGERAMFGGIADAQPDAWGRRLIDANRRREANSSDTRCGRASELDVLSAVPDATRQGAMRVIDNGIPIAANPSGTPTLVDLQALVEMARAFEDGEEVTDEFARLINAGTSMGGARPKVTVRRNDGTLAIAKLPRSDDFGDAMAWEATALELARLSGVRVPRFDLHRTGYRSVLVVDRFDRDGERRIGYLSADSLLVKQPNDFVDYTMLIEAIAPISSSPRADGEELFRRIALTLLVNNIDDHMKNHGLIRTQNGWKMSPAFDVNPFYRQGTASSTPVSSNDDPNARDIRNLLDVSDSFSLTRARAIEIIRQVEEATAGWRNVALGFGIPAEGANAMAAAFENDNRQAARSMTPPTATPKRISNDRQPRNAAGEFDFKSQSAPELPTPEPEPEI
jgi:serine/threonine-protein kinase HipA